MMMSFIVVPSSAYVHVHVCISLFSAIIIQVYFCYVNSIFMNYAGNFHFLLLLMYYLFVVEYYNISLRLKPQKSISL